MARAGVLIVGSLEWDDATHRVAWRNKHLTETPGIPVKVPLRYGRRSMGRAKTYTMVFAPGCPDGQAKVFACRGDVSLLPELVKEAEGLWTAERPGDSTPEPNQQHSASWGCVVVLRRPNADCVQHLLDGWKNRLVLERHQKNKNDKNDYPNYDSSRYAVKTRAAISDKGLLNIDWPMRADTGGPLDSFDLLLATATRPTPVNNDFPDPKTIADAWNGARTAVYFWMNRRRGFWTFQDAEIERHLRV